MAAVKASRAPGGATKFYSSVITDDVRSTSFNPYMDFGASRPGTIKGEIRMMKKHASWVLIFVLLQPFCAMASGIQGPLARIIAKNTQARGGAGPISSVQSIHTRIQISEPKFQVSGEYFATRKGQMRIDIFADGKRVFTEAYDGAHGWQMSSDGTITAMSEAGEKAVRHGIVSNLYGLFEMPGSGRELKYAGSEEVDGRDYEKIDLRFEDGLVDHYYLDGESGLVVRERDEIALHPDVDDTVKRYETVHGDFRPVGGVVYAWRSEKKEIDTGNIVQVIEVQEIVQNPEIDAMIFARPGA
jgi:hypothetical protein